MGHGCRAPTTGESPARRYVVRFRSTGGSNTPLLLIVALVIVLIAVAAYFLFLAPR